MTSEIWAGIAAAAIFCLIYAVAAVLAGLATKSEQEGKEKADEKEE